MCAHRDHLLSTRATMRNRAPGCYLCLTRLSVNQAFLRTALSQTCPSPEPSHGVLPAPCRGMRPKTNRVAGADLGPRLQIHLKGSLVCSATSQSPSPTPLPHHLDDSSQNTPELSLLLHLTVSLDASLSLPLSTARLGVVARAARCLLVAPCSASRRQHVVMR